MNTTISHAERNLFWNDAMAAVREAIRSGCTDEQAAEMIRAAHDQIDNVPLTAAELASDVRDSRRWVAMEGL